MIRCPFTICDECASAEEDGLCVVCKGGDDEGTMRLCMECGDNYHCLCHRPTLTGRGEGGDWYCQRCVKKRGKPSRHCL